MSPRVRVCLTFDLDAISGPLFKHQRLLPSILSRGEYGATVGTPRLLALLERYGIRSTWFIPGHTADSFPAAARAVFEAGHEIAHHGYCHEPPAKLSADDERWAIEAGSAALQRITGRAPRGYRAPAWAITNTTLSLLRERGFTYDSSLSMDDYRLHYVREGDVPALDGYRFGNDTSLVEVPITWALDDYEYYAYIPPGPTGTGIQGGKLPHEVVETWSADFDYLYEHAPGGVLTITMHPEVSGRGPRVLGLERLIQHIRQFPDAEFCAVEDAVDAWLTAGQEAR